MKKRIILVGKSASGKDHARKTCDQWFGLQCGISFTTRPPREEEQNGIDYYFIEKPEFEGMIDQDMWYEYVMFNGWYYGTLKEHFYESREVFIMTPTGISHLNEKDRSESFILYFDIDENIRKTRMQNRKGNADSIERRLIADEKDFKDFKDYDVKVSNPAFTIKFLFECICTNVNESISNKIKNHFYGAVYNK